MLVTCRWFSPGTPASPPKKIMKNNPQDINEILLKVPLNITTITITMFYKYKWNITFQQYFSYIVVYNFIGEGNQSIQKKKTRLSQVTEKLDHILRIPGYRVHPVLNGIWTHKWVLMIDTYKVSKGKSIMIRSILYYIGHYRHYIGTCRCKSNYDMILVEMKPHKSICEL